MPEKMTSNFLKISLPLTPPIPTPGGNTRNSQQQSGGLKRQSFFLGRSFSLIDDRYLAFTFESLMEAVDRDDYGLCVRLLNGGTPVNAPGDTVDGKPNYTTPLILATQKRHHRIVSLLLMYDVNVNAKNKNDRTALHFAAMNNDVSSCSDLLNAEGIDVLCKDNMGDTPLHLAVRHSCFDACRELLGRHSETVKRANKKGHTPLHVAAMSGNTEILSLLIDYGADWDVRDNLSFLPLHHAAKKGHDGCCKILISESQEIATKQLRAKVKDGRTPLMLAASGGFHYCCALMINADVGCSDRQGNTALHYAVKGLFVKTVSYLLHRNANPNLRNKLGNTPLLEAVANFKTSECTKVLLENGGDVRMKNDKGQTVLHVAALKCSDWNMELLLTLDTVREMVDTRDEKGYTAFHYSILKKSPKCTHLLLNHGASVNIPTRNLMTPLHLAAAACNTELCELFLKQKGIKVNQDNADMEKPLHLAALHGSADCCNILLRRGALIFPQDAKGRTPLHLAAKKQNADCIQLLARKGALIRAKDNDGRTALHYAAEAGSLSCCTFLVHNAKSLLWEETESDHLPLDVAFCKNHDEIFGFIMKNLSRKNGQRNLEARLHDYMHRAVLDKRVVAIEAMVESAWWRSIFRGHRGPCENFNQLIEHYPHLAKRVLDRCYIPKESTSDLTLIENDFYIPSAFTGKREMDPFNLSTGKLPPYARSFYESQHTWYKKNAITKMIQHKREGLVLHPVTKAWVINRWNSYARTIFIMYLAVEFVFAVLLSVLTSEASNWIQQSIRRDIICALSGCYQVSDSDPDCITNVTEHISSRCSNTSWDIAVPAQGGDEAISARSYSVDTEKLPLILCSGVVPHWTTTTLSTTVLIVVLLFIFLGVEINCLIRLRQSYWSWECILRWLRVILTFAFVLPFTQCCIETGVKEGWQLVSGVMAVLLEGLLFINALNKLPVLSVFLPVTKDFIRTYMKVVAYILALILLFAFLFHLLLRDQKAFRDVPQAMVKTIVLMLGDYSYDSLFLKNKVEYPVIANLLFVVFITTISGFLVNLIITKPDNAVDDFRSRATLNRAASSVHWILTLDTCLPFFRKRYAVGKYVDLQMSQLDQWHKSLNNKMLMLNEYERDFEEVVPVKEEQELNRETLQILLELSRDHKNQISELKHELKALRKLTGVDLKTANSPTKITKQ